MGLSEDQLFTINDLVTATTVFSFFGSLTIILSLLYFTYAQQFGEVLKKCGINVDWVPNDRVNLTKEKIAFRLVFNVGVSDLIYETSFWFTNPATHSESAACEFSGWLQQFGTLSSIMWVTCITYVINTIVTNPERYKSITSDMWKFHATIWPTSFITSFFPMFSSSYGQAGGWCWIDSTSWGIFWRFALFYAPVWAIIIYISYIFYQSYRSLGGSNRILKQMRLYPAILIGTWTFGTINRIVQAAGKDVFGLVLIHAFLMSLYGFFNCLAYLYTPSVRESVLALCGYSADLNTNMVVTDQSAKADVELSNVDEDQSSSDLGPATASSFDANVDIGVSDIQPSESFNVVYAKTGSSEEFKPNTQDGAAIEVQATYAMGDQVP